MSTKHKLLIYGASGHAKVIFDAALKQGEYEIFGFLDDNEQSHGRDFMGLPVLGGFEYLEESSYKQDLHVVIGIGENHVRETLGKKIAALGVRFASVVHPSAVMGIGVRFGEGTVVMGGAVINADSEIGEHVIVNTGATVDHDCVIGDYAHISPGAHLAGGVKVGELSQLGIGASAIPGVEIGEKCIIGAGAAVVDNIPSDVTAVGVPAKVVVKS